MEDVKMIEQSPDRPNLLYLVEYLDKSHGLEVQFGKLIKELKASGVKTPRTVIYCQTRKQCSILYRMFQVYLGGKFFMVLLFLKLVWLRCIILAHRTQ